MTTDWGALQRAIEGDVVLPGSADYESVRKPVMARFRARAAIGRRTMRDPRGRRRDPCGRARATPADGDP
jgi:hypothetical protein